MANDLKMDKVFAILALHEAGWSNRRIARELGIHRGTVGRHLRLVRVANPLAGPCGGPKPATNLPTGSEGSGLTGNLAAGLAFEAPAGLSSRADAGSPSNGGFIALRPPACRTTLDGAAAEDRAPLGSDPSAAAVPNGTGGIPTGAARLVASPRAPCLSSGPPGRSGPASDCEPFREVVQAKVEEGHSAQRIYQDLVGDHGFGSGYDSVKRFVRKLRAGLPLPFRRMECAPGDEAQVDFGSGAPVVDADGRRRRVHVFRVVLSHSRKAYSEAVWREGTDEFLQGLENAFWDFGGVPRTTVIDNLKAAVTHPDWYDPDLNPKVQSFCRHYGTVILPTRPRTPRHKGKVERGIDYVQENGLKGRRFSTLSDENRHLAHWEATVADTRIHGTTRRQVGKVFAEVERPALGALPAGRFPRFQEARRTVHRDGHVEVAKAYYSVPPEYLGREVWVRWDGRLVRVFNHRFEQIAVHSQREAGRFSTRSEHIDPRKVSAVERGTTWLLKKAARIGPRADQWAQAMLQERGIEGVRVLVGLVALAKTYPSGAIEEACDKALAHGAFRLRVLREVLKRGGDRQEQFEFLQKHPIIRDLSEYGQWVRASLRGEPAVTETP